MTMTMSAHGLSLDVEEFRTRDGRERDRIDARPRVNQADDKEFVDLGDSALVSSAESRRHERWTHVSAELRGFFQLYDDWDSEGASAIPYPVILTAETYLYTLSQTGGAPPDRVLPLPSGGILMEWRTRGENIEIEVSEPNKLEIMRSRAGLPPTFEELPWVPPNG